MGLFSNIFGDPNDREIKRLQPIIDKINGFEPEMEKLKDEDFAKKTAEFKKIVSDKLSNDERLNVIETLEENDRKQRRRAVEMDALDEVLPCAFALVREAAKRRLGLRHYDVQCIGGIILHEGKIAEMKTGEGKTLVASLAIYLNALTVRGAHLVTVNDYLSKRDAGWMGPIYHLLGMSTAAIGHEASWLFDPEIKNDETDEKIRHFRPITRKEAYAADITYGTNNEYGFDYLRDNMAVEVEQLVQRPLHFAIVDEVDSILIDEARTPLIISAPAEESASLYAQFAELVTHLKEKTDYNVDEKLNAATLTDEGMEKVEKSLGYSIYNADHVHLVHHMEESLKAKALFKKDKDYVVKDGEVIIVDEFTGRMMPGRRYSEGLHQAIEAKEGVEVKRESDTLATISFQNFFRVYEKLAGMTGTAATEAEEFYKIYKLDVTVIPPNKPSQRKDKQDLIYKNEEAKYNAVTQQIKEKSEAGQPVLVGTISIQKSERLSKLLRRQGIKHNVLNAKHHEKEAKTIAGAGSIGTVTVATNMAGRGVDIILGGTPPEDKKSQDYKEWEQAHEKVKSLGGLHVIGTERHEARRIDNQLRGRSGRQGDMGSSVFFVSLDDDLMRIFGGDRLKSVMQRLGVPDDMPIEHALISRSIESAQKKVEGHNFDIRKHLVEYDDVMNKHREIVYKRRQRILKTGTGELEDEDWLHNEVINLIGEDGEDKKNFLEKIKKYGLDVIRQVERAIYLRTIDSLWIEHLNAMESLREGIGLRGYGQREPLVEYKHEAYKLFQQLTRIIDDQAIDVLLRIEVQGMAQEPMKQRRRNMVMRGADESMAGGSIQNEQQLGAGEGSGKNGVITTVRNSPMAAVMEGANKKQAEVGNKLGRNDPCPCGNGKKYKRCHGA